MSHLRERLKLGKSSRQLRDMEADDYASGFWDTIISIPGPASYDEKDIDIRVDGASATITICVELTEYGRYDIKALGAQSESGSCIPPLPLPVTLLRPEFKTP
ncbi:hypothetical protein MKEN_00221800 [Mycena kentingensis (nom. inval.)]|nr:hypothetical protein MKEN_00221800 [Mycena kentingensis (nom. inval.)]